MKKITTSLSLAALLLASGAALADPENGRRPSATMPLAKAGIWGAAGDRGDLPKYFPKFASESDYKLIKAMGDIMLRAPRGEKLVAVGHTTWERSTKTDGRIVPRRVSFVVHIDGGRDDGTTVKAPTGLTAKIDYCRGMWASYIVDYELTLAMVQPLLNQLVSDATPYLNRQMGDRYSYSVSGITACKLAGSQEWAFYRGGKAFGRDRWVFTERYTPSTATHPAVQVMPIPQHRRNDALKAEVLAWTAPPVNQYDAALMPTPGDVDGMKDIGGTAAPSGPTGYSVEAARRLLTQRPIRNVNGQIITFSPDGRATLVRYQDGRELDAGPWRLEQTAAGLSLVHSGDTGRFSPEETTDLLRRLEEAP